MKDHEEAESKKVTSQEIQQALIVQTKNITEKKAYVMDDLSKVEPAVIEAQQGTCCYSKQYFTQSSLWTQKSWAILTRDRNLRLMGQNIEN